MKRMNQILIERQTGYHVLALFYRGDITKGLNILLDPNFGSLFTGATTFGSLIAPVITIIRGHKDDLEYKKTIIADYQRLFIGPEKLLAPPWASVYLTKEKLLFGEPERVVRKFYQSVRLAVSKAEPADHIALELAFMARLCTSAQIEAVALKTQRSFLETHLLHWIAAWKSDVVCSAQTDFWPLLTEITYNWLGDDLNSLVD